MSVDTRNARSKPTRSLDPAQAQLAVENTLRWLHLLECKLPKVVDQISVTLRLSRLLCVFLAGMISVTLRLSRLLCVFLAGMISVTLRLSRLLCVFLAGMISVTLRLSRLLCVFLAGMISVKLCGCRQ